MRKVYISLTIQAVIVLDDNADVEKVTSEMTCELEDTTGQADIDILEVGTVQVTDSK